MRNSGVSMPNISNEKVVQLTEQVNDMQYSVNVPQQSAPNYVDNKSGYGVRTVRPYVKKKERDQMSYLRCYHDEEKELIGQGRQGQVFRVESRMNKVFYAVKVCSLLIADEIRCDVDREISLLSDISSDWILKFHAKYEIDGLVYIVTDYHQHGSLLDIMKRNGVFNDFYVKVILEQTLQAGLYLHKHDIMHRDIKPSNLLQSSDGHIVLCDFGSATNENKNVMTRSRGTGCYMAPQLARWGQKYDEKCDVYSIGMTALACMHWVPNENEFNLKMMRICDDLLENNYSKDVKDKDLCTILSKMISIDPNKRPTARESLELWRKLTYHKQDNSITAALCVRCHSLMDPKSNRCHMCSFEQKNTMGNGRGQLSAIAEEQYEYDSTSEDENNQPKDSHNNQIYTYSSEEDENQLNDVPNAHNLEKSCADLKLTPAKQVPHRGMFNEIYYEICKKCWLYNETDNHRLQCPLKNMQYAPKPKLPQIGQSGSALCGYCWMNTMDTEDCQWSEQHILMECTVIPIHVRKQYEFHIEPLIQTMNPLLDGNM